MDQAGENIAFGVHADGSMEAHVQILYSGAADEFAWILPVPSLPTLSVGTDALFTTLAQSTAPRFLLNRRTEGTCRPQPQCPDYGYYPGAPPEADAAEGADSGTGGDDGVTVHSRSAVGPYDAIVITVDDPNSPDGASILVDWLQTNGYQIPDASRPILMDHVVKGDYFVALKLLSGRDTGEIQPIVLDYQEAEPCIPLRLTAIATVPDMPITAYVFAASRTVPANYMAITPDLNVPDFWVGGTRSYVTHVSEAIDDAGGRAWVTEFANTPPPMNLTLPSVEDLRASASPADFLQRLQDRGYNRDSQIQPILERFLPPPDGADPQWFYNCITSSWCEEFDSYLATLDWQPSLMVDALNTAIRDPRERANLLQRHAKLTRLFTTMSAEEMIKDPIFTFDAALPNVSNEHWADLITVCSEEYFDWTAPRDLEMPNGSRVNVYEGLTYMADDSQYCEDMAAGDFAPWASDEANAATSARREAEAAAPRLKGGAAICSVDATSQGSPSAFLWLVAGTLGITFMRRRIR